MSGESIIYAPAGLQNEVAERLAGMPVSVKVSTNGHLPPPPPMETGKVIVVVSPKGGSGKTAVSSNLAVALAEQQTAEAHSPLRVHDPRASRVGRVVTGVWR